MGETIGPLTSKQVREFAKNRTITRDILLRKREEGKWVLADRVKGLFKEPHPEMTEVRLSTAIINSEKNLTPQANARSGPMLNESPRKDKVLH